MDHSEIGTIMKMYLSGGELREVQRIAEKPIISEKELDFIIAMAGRTCKFPIQVKPPLNEVLIRSNGFHFTVFSVSPNNHLQN